jgi:hypothetical protein
MVSLLDGFVAGVIAGVIMGLTSDVCFRLNLFKSSLFVIDGSFLFHIMKKKVDVIYQYATGIPIHLITSAVFGSIYVIMLDLFQLNTISSWSVTFYFLLLWLAMLFVALPIAGYGLLGRKIHHATWQEQLLLHVVFGFTYYSLLELFRG